MSAELEAAPLGAGEADMAQIGRLITYMRGGRVLTAAAMLGVFDALAEGPLTDEQVAQRIGGDGRATRLMLDALVALGLARKSQGRYANTPVGQRHLTCNGSASIADNLRYQELLAPAWAALPQIVRTGAPAQELGRLLAEDPVFTRRYIRGMADIARRPAGELASQLELGHARDALDVGGGPAAYARALVERNPALRVVLLDLPPTLAIARELLEDWPLRQQIELRAGDYHEADFGRACFDLVLFSHVTHDEGEAANQRLLAKAFEALRPGGQVVIHDFMLDPDRTGPLFPALFSIHMLTYTRQGRAYSADEYQQWIQGCGFREARQIDVCAGSPNATRALIAVKP